MQNENRELREERGRIVGQMKKLSDAGIRSNDDKAQFGRLDAEAKRLTERIDLIERADDLYQEQRKSGAPPNARVGDIVGPSEQHDQQYKRAFRNYLMRGRSELTMEDRAILRMETRDMGDNNAAAYPGASGASFLVAPSFVYNVERALKYYGPMLNGGRGYPKIVPTTTGAPMPWPTSNDTSVMGELISENQQVTDQDVLISAIIFGAWKMSTKLVKVSLELMQDSAFDIEAFLVEQFAQRIGRAANFYLTTGLGSGSSQPYGIIPATLAGGLTTTALGASSNDGVSGPSTIGSDDLVRLEHLVDPLYRPGAAYMAHDTTIAALKMVKDKYGRPLWQPSVKDGTPDTVNGYPILSNPYMDTIQTGPNSPQITRNTVLFGQLEKYIVRRVKDLSVLRLSERFADFGQVAFLGFFRFDGQLLDAGTHPTAILQNVY